MNNRKARMT